MFTNAIDLLNLAKQNDVDIILNGDQIQLKIPKGRTIDKGLLEELKANKKLIIDFLSGDNLEFTAVSLNNQKINSFNRDVVKRIPLSFSQERLWFIDRLEGSVQYHIPAVLRLKGSLDSEVLEKTLQGIINRHEVLRTVIREQEGQGYQQIMSADGWTLGIIEELSGDKSDLSPLIAGMVSKPFDLSADYMLRADLIRLNPDEHILVVTMHHIASDGWSVSILVKEVIALYEGYAGNRETELPALPIQYADYAMWQRNYLQGELLANKLGYWKTKLADVAPLQLPIDFSRPAAQSSRGAAYDFKIEQGLSAQLINLSQQQGATLYMTLLAAFNVLLYRYSGQEDICIGTPVVGRNHPELEGLIGFFVNTLALRSQVIGDRPFTTLLEEVKNTTLDAYDNQEVPFEKVVDAVVKARDMSRNPLFQVLFSLQNTPEVPVLELGELRLSTEGQEHTTTQFDLSFMIRETNAGILGTVEYCTDLYKEETIGRMTSHYIQLLESIVASPENQVSRLGMLGSAEEETLLTGFNATDADYGRYKSIISLFQEQVTKNPEAIAIKFENEQLTYQELNARSNQLAHYLQKQGVKAETLVPVCIERSINMITGILGILKAGGAYVPIDPAYPEDRIRYMLEDTGAELVLSSTASREKLNESSTSTPVIEIDGDWELIAKEKSDNLKTNIPQDQLAYVIYTSGSTGRPKGVMIEHRSVYAFIAWCQSEFQADHFEIAYAVTSICFDLSVFEMFYPLSTGKQVRILENGLAISKYVTEDNLVLINTVPSVVEHLINEKTDMSRVSMINMAGEPIPLRVLEGLDTNNTAVRNLYGPTEDTTYSTNTVLEKGKAITIGKPIANTRIYILNNNQELSPMGVPGEICIGGAGLAREYLNQPGLTAEKFIKNPFSKEETRLYRTGDLGRWLPDGNIEYMGRIDDQVKVRGFRIELGEIESVLNQHSSIQQAVVLAKEDKQGTKRLVGYIVAATPFDKQAIQNYLSTKLPEYMVPAIWVELENIPLTPNGKIDRKALPDPELTDAVVEYVAPRNEIEQTLAGIWQELLGLERVGIYDNFFELGGDSILTIQVVSRMRRAGYIMQPKDIFNHQAIASLSNAIGRGLESVASGEQGMLSGSFGLLPIQSWYLEKEPVDISHFNQRVLLKINKIITAEILQSTLDQLRSQHDVLRLVFKKTEGAWQQEYGTSRLQLDVDDLRDVPGTNLAEMISARSDTYQRSLAIERDQLMRMVLMQTPETEQSNRLLIVIHHLAVDGVSWRIMLEDMEQLLSGLMSGEQVSLGAKSSSYRQWHAALVKYSGNRRLSAQKEYWERSVHSYKPLPVDKKYAGEVLWKDMVDYQVRLGAEQTRYLLQEIPRVYHTEINDLLLGALCAALCGWSGSDRVVIGLEGHGREDISAEIDSSRTVGWFTSLYPVLLKAGTDTSILIKGVKEELRRIPDKGLGYGVLKYINKTESIQGRDPWDIIFNYLGQLDTVVTSGRWLAAAGESSGTAVSENQATISKLSVNSHIFGGELVLNWSYSSRHYNQETISKVAGDYITQLLRLIAHCQEQKKSGAVYTPSDYGLTAEITYQELDRFLESSYRDKPIKDQIEGLYRLSGLQQGMLFHGLYDSFGSYIEQFGFDLVGVNLETLLASWSKVISRHSILRSAFYYDSFSVPVQCVYREVKLPVEELDYRGMDAVTQRVALKEYDAADRARGFDFKSAPLMRLGLIRLDEDRYRMVWTSHHILFDGWSLAILMEEFLSTYELLANGNAIPDEDEDRYEDYIRYLERKNKDDEERYWRDYLAGISQGTLLPFVRNTAERTKGTGRYESLAFVLDDAATERIKGFVQSQRLTLNTLMQGVWALLLHSYTGSNEIVYGVVVSGRPDELSGVEHRVGMYINTLTFKALFGENQETVNWLQSLQVDQVSSRQYQHTALQDVQGWTGIKGDLFDSLLIFENYPVSKLVASGSWSLQVENLKVAEQTNYPLTITIGSSDELSISLSYNTDLLEQTYVTAIRDQFEQVLLQITSGQANTLSDIRMLTASQEHVLLVDLNATDAEYPKDKNIIELFQAQMIRNPEATAVVFEGLELSYRALNERSNQLAHYLQRQGVKTETLVPICVERSLEMVVGILGILKAGGAYIPIDPDYPADRISYMLQDTGAELVVSSRSCRSKVSENQTIRIVELDNDWDTISKETVVNVDVKITPVNLAYVIYTSGSTGKPKGVMIEHRSVINLLTSISNDVDFTPSSKFLSVTTYSFDICYLELYVPLINGAQLVIVSRDTASDGFLLMENLSKYRPTHMQGTPSTWQLLADAGWTNEERVKMLIGGEPVKEGIKEYLTKIGDVWNVYGPTETTIWSTIKKLASGEKVSIGKPISNTRIYMLNGDGQLSPVGVTGEICIGGDGLARGYLNRLELTSEKFVADPFSEEEGARLYRTGDLGRWLADGNIECLGRIDDQVKIRGYRIELGEIETVMNQLDEVQSSCVVVNRQDELAGRLVSYFVANAEAVKTAEHQLYSLQVNSWKEIYENEYGLEDKQQIKDPEFNIIIWNDSFTRKPIPEEQMREWQSDIVDVILAEQPENVLEIGCGTGLIYYPLAGKLKKYIGTDLSRHSIEKISKRISKGLRDYGVTELQVSAAHEISLPANEQLDTIIINSVVQYFPGADYLTSVIENSIGLLNGRGRIIIGDVRDRRLLELFKTRLHLAKIQGTEDIKEFKWAVEQDVVKEEELCFAPEYFYNLQLLYPEITHISIQWKKSSYYNELSLYRYTVIIYVGIEKEVLSPSWEYWNMGDAKQTIFDQLKQGQGIVTIKDAPNPRLWQEKQLFDALHESTLSTTGDILSAISQKHKGNGEIEEVLKEAADRGYHCRFLLDEDPFKTNILLELNPSGDFIKSAYSNKNTFIVRSYTNIPLFDEIGKLMQKEIKSLLQQRLPDYMLPSEFIALQSLPLNSNGKIDRKFLSQRTNRISTNKFNYQPPSTETEQALASIWQKLLNADRLGVNDNFFELGGHSLLAMRVLSSIRRELKVDLNIRDLFVHPTIGGLAAHLSGQNKGSLLPAVVAADRPEFIPLSFSQERLWFIDRLEGSLQYHLPAVLRLKGDLNKEALENTLRTIINRHEVLRTVILEHEGQGYQHIMPADNWSLGIIKDTAGAGPGLSSSIAGLISKPFDLASNYMLRANLIKIDQEDYILVVTMHHIASDGWSTSILVKEVIALYESYTGNTEKELPVLAVQYADYAIWQRQYMQGEVLENKLDYWKEKLEGVAPLQLPIDFARPAIQSSRGATRSFKIEQGLSADLLDLSHQQGATLYMTLLATFKVLLSRYSGQEDICVGTPIAGRNQQELEGLIGFFVNTLALRSQVRKDMAFSELLEEVKMTTLEAYEYQEVPFEKVVDAVVKERDMSRNPLFQVLFSFQNTPEVPALKLGELSLSAEGHEHTTTQFDLLFLVRETSTGIRATVEYATDLYKAETIARMISHYINLLGSIVASPESEVSRLGMLNAEEEEILLVDFNNTQADYPKDKSVVDLFEEQALKNPEAIALVYEDQELSYGELNARSNQLAHYLQKQGVKAETLVPICVERSVEMVIGILGILKAGGAYVPVDPAYPQDRISYMLEDTGASIVLCNKESSGHLQGTSVSLIELEGDWNLIEKEKSNNLQTVINPEQLAYVIYTSGSTGKPKGVMIEHQSLVNYLSNNKTNYVNEDGVNSGSFIHLSYTFDASLTGLFMPLLSGKYIVLGSGDALEVFTDRNLAKYAPYDFIKITPSHLGLLPTKFKSAGGSWLTGKLVIGGEALRLSQFDPLIQAGINVEIINEYGPTEATIGCSTYSFYTLGEHEFTQNEVPIGKPIANAQIYILSGSKELSPIGVPGEICIGGDGLARGYLNRPELTAEKFINNPFSKESGARLYKTGDLGRWLPDGNIEYLGRIDDQVKIRGYRIELGEIESVLNQYSDIQQAVVLAKEDSSGNKRLIGYVVPKEEFNKQDTQDYLNSKLPEYMVPALWVELESMPLTPNGKIDRRALPDPELTDRTDEYAAPRNETEEKLAEIWQEMLDVDRVGIHDDFFDIGGHSLLAISLVSTIRKVFGLELPINDVFDYPTVSLLAGRLAEEPSGELLPPVMAITPRPEHIPLSFSQERLWFLDRLEGSLQYHLPAVLRLKGELNKEALEQTLQTIINRHEVLRTVILEHEGVGYQQILPADSWILGIIEEPGYEEGTEGLFSFIAGLISKPFDLSGDYMLRADLIRLNQDEHILVVTMHHIASDGWSTSILVKEVIALYEGYANHTETVLPSLPIQYADYAIWQRNYLQGEVLDNKLSYWKEKLTGVAPLQLPADYNRPAIQSSRGATHNFKIEQRLSAQLVDLSHRHGATLYMTLLSAFKVLLYRYSGQEDICVGTPVAGRNQQELEGLIGFFINTLALRSQVSGDMPFTTLLAEVKRTTLEAYGHQEVPFEKVVDAVVKERDMSRNPLFQVLFSLQNTPEVPALKLGELSLSAENQGHTTSKFDLAFMIVETNSGIQAMVEYCTDLYKEETVDRMISHYLNLLQSIIASPENQVSRLGMLSDVEGHTLLIRFNDTTAAYPKDKSIVTLFEEQVIKNPEAIALVFGQDRLTYQQLNERSNQLAHYLQKQGVQAETLVPVCMERSINMVVGLLGIMKAGGAYVPVDPSYPEDRIRYMVEDTRASIVLSNTANKGKLSESNITVIHLDSDWELICGQSSTNLDDKLSADQLAYVIYTSGSTGKPKGVMIEHHSLVNLAAWHNQEYEVTETSKATSMAGVGFDAFGWEIWPYLSAGASIYIIDNDTRLSAAALSALFIDEHITHSFVSTALVPDFIEASRHKTVSLKYLLTGGDKLSAVNLAGITYTLVNNYGPTENTVVATNYIVSQNDKVLPIGKPISNTRIHILSSDGELSPIGVPGEICIGGASLARGYLNRPDLTAEKFNADPFSKEPGARVYKTGDLGRWLPDGNIEYMGRIDDQVKIRGFRIELGEIESVLNQHNGIQQAVVLAKEDKQGIKRLVGYVVPEGTFDQHNIQSYLSTKLPDYMVPTLWIELESIPLTPNGKIDRKALPNPELQSIVTEYVAPRNATETTLAGIWQELLGLERIGIYDNFFELGGHSLLAMRVVSAIERELSVSIPIHMLFQFTSISDLSKYLEFEIQTIDNLKERNSDEFDEVDL